jgi:hypothetical protein
MYSGTPIKLRYRRNTAKYWVFEDSAGPGAASGPVPCYATVYLRQRPGTRPDFVTVAVTEGRDAPQVQAGRFMDDDDDADPTTR